MEESISRLIDRYDRGKLSRRHLVTTLAAVAGLSAAVRSVGGEPTFRATGLNHIALSVTDVERSRDFYVRHLGLEVASQSLPGSCFLDCGPDFVALFRGSEPGMHHYCYSIPNYSQQDAAERLRAVGIEPSLRGRRIYFPDPDGLTVQLAADDLRG